MAEAAYEDGWSGVALVTVTGRVRPVSDGAAAALLREHSELAAYAPALLGSSRCRLAAIWIAPDGGWYDVSISRAEDCDTRSDAMLELHRTQPPFQLTVRELDVLTLIAGGLSNREVARGLGTSARTVSTQVERVLAKLGQGTRAGAAAVAVERGLLRIPVPGGGPSLGSLAVGEVDQIAAGRPPAVAWRDGLRYPKVRIRLTPMVVGSLIAGVGIGLADGREFVHGSALAIAEINQRGGVGGRLVEQVTVGVDIESRTSIEAGVSDLIDQGVDAITCGYFLVAADAALLSVAAYGCPFLHSMTAEETTALVASDADALGSIFQVCPTEAPYGVGFIRTLDALERKAGWVPQSRRIAFAETTALGGRAVTPATIATAERSAWEIDRTFTVDVGNADWAPVVDYLGREAPAAILVDHAVAAEAANFQLLFTQHPTDTIIHTIYAPSTPEYLLKTCAHAEGVIWSTVAGIYDDALGRSFRDRYRDRFGEWPGGSLAGIAYDQVNLLAQAWGGAEHPRRFADVCRELRQSVVRGVIGSYWFANPEQRGLAYPDDTADPSLGQAHLIYQIQTGRHRPLAPSPYGDSRFVPPSWFARPRRQAVSRPGSTGRS